MRIEAKDLQQALMQAAQKLECSVIDIEYEVIQYHQSGLFGLFKKTAIIEARSKKKHRFDKKFSKKKGDFNDKPKHNEKKDFAAQNKNYEKNQVHKNAENESPRTTNSVPQAKYELKNDEIFNSFHKESHSESKFYIDEIRIQLDKLIKAGEFGVKITELSVYDKDSIYIKLEGEDAALLIGKEAYRYKALSYLLHNWINSRYNLLIRLEIADFLRNQSQSMDFYLQGIIERVEATGRAQTKPLDGVLVKLALEKLRERFPNKYVGIRQNDDDEKFVIINDFFKKDE